MNDRREIAVVVPLFNRLELTKRFCSSFESVEGANFQLIFVDDGSTDGTGEWLRQNQPEAVVLNGNGDLWWTGGTNLGVQHALENNFRYVLTINNDAVVKPDFLVRLMQTANENPRSIVGCTLFDSQKPERIWALGGHVDWKHGRPFSIGKPESISPNQRLYEVDILPGCGVLIPTDCFREIGLFNDRWFPQYHADSEFTIRAYKSGYRIVVDALAKVWYDTENSFNPRSLWSSLFSKRSPAYWKPILGFHLSYCPWHLIAWSIACFYLGYNRFTAGFFQEKKGG